MHDGSVFELTAAERALLPSEGDVAFYDTHGWFMAPRLFTDDHIDMLATMVDEHRRRESASDRLPPEDIGDVVPRPLLAAIAARLASADQVRLWQVGRLYKGPKNTDDYGTVSWHTDRAYWRHCSSTRMLTAWIALQDCDEALGPVTMVDGSHAWPDTLEVRGVRHGQTFSGTTPGELHRRLELTGQPIRAVPMTLRRGEVSFHHCLTVHGSGPNLTERPRVGVAVHFQDGENRFQRAYEDDGAEAPSHQNDRFCRKLANGDPDYADPRVCPLLWSG